MAVAQKSAPNNTRTVVLLSKSAKRKLERTAARENVSSGEIIRRSLESFESIEARVRKEEEQKVIEATLDLIIESLSSVNRSMEQTFKQLDELHLELSK